MSERSNPYVGLEPFGAADAEWFFGREREITLISANLKASRLTLLYGASGVGKSSVLLAGVLPHLRAVVATNRELAAAEQRGGLALEERPPIAVALVRDWRDAPLKSVAAAVRESVAEASGRSDVPARGAKDTLAEYLETLGTYVRTLLVILDQFEEYFMYHPDEDGEGTLAGELPGVINQVELRANFVIGLREDALSQLDRFKGHIPNLFGNYLRLDHLDRDAGRQAIIAPAQHFNETVRAALPPVVVHGDLVEDVLDEIRAGRLTLTEGQEPASADSAATPSSAGERIETPFLQLVMRELWIAGAAADPPEITRATLTALGGAPAIVSNHLVTAMSQLSEDDQGVAADIFAFLVTPSRTKIAHSAQDLAYWSQRPAADVERVLDTLSHSERRILREQDDLYELYHDVLAEAVYDWSTRIRQQRALAAEQRERRRRLIRRALLILGIVVLVAAAFLVAYLLTRDNGETPAAKSHRLAEAAAAQLGTDTDRSLQLALGALSAKPTAEARDAAGAALSAQRVRASYVGADALPCRLGACRDLRSADRNAGPVSLVPHAARDRSARAGVLLAPGEDQRVAVAPDGRTIAVIRSGGRVMMWKPEAGGTPAPLPSAHDVRRVAFVGDGRRLLMLTDEGVLLMGADGEPAPHPLPKGAAYAAATADGRYVATAAAGAGNGLTVQNTEDGQRTRVKVDGPVASLAFDKSGKKLLVATNDGVWAGDWRRGKLSAIQGAKPYPSEIQDGTPQDAMHARFTPDGRHIVISTAQKKALVIDTKRLEPAFESRRPFFNLGVADVDRPGRRLLTINRNVASLWNMSNGRLLKVLGGHTAPILAAAFSDDGTRVVTGAADGTAIVWDVEADPPQAIATLHAAGRNYDSVATTHVEFGRGGRVVVTGGTDGTARVWSVTAGTPLAGTESIGPPEVGFTANGDTAITVGEGDGYALTFDGHTGRTTGQSTPLGPCIDSDLSTDGTTVACAEFEGGATTSLAVGPVGRSAETATLFAYPFIQLSGNGRVVLLPYRRPKLYDVATRRSTPIGGGLIGDAQSGAINADGSRVLLNTRAGRTFIVDVRDPDHPVELRDAALRTDGEAAFSPDGSHVVTTGGAVALVWDIAKAAVDRRLRSYTGGVTSVAYSPDGKRIATGGDEGTVLIRSTRGKYRLLETLNTGRTPGRLAFSADGRILMAPFDGSPVVLYTCNTCQSPDTVKADAQQAVTRDLLKREDKFVNGG
jgi:WD40 repeat protein